jgi:flotillin
MARAAIAEAEKVEAERRAALEATAKAEKAKMVVDAEAQAEKRRIEAEGEASAIFAKLEAEAKGQYEIMAKKAEGLRMIVDACGGSQQAFQMLMLEHLDNLAEASSKAISNIKFDKIVVWENGNGQNGSTSGFLQSMARTMPPMMQVLKDIGGVDLPETLAKFTSGESAPAIAANGNGSPVKHTSGE